MIISAIIKDKGIKRLVKISLNNEHPFYKIVDRWSVGNPLNFLRVKFDLLS